MIYCLSRRVSDIGYNGARGSRLPGTTSLVESHRRGTPRESSEECVEHLWWLKQTVFNDRKNFQTWLQN